MASLTHRRISKLEQSPLSCLFILKSCKHIKQLSVNFQAYIKLCKCVKIADIFECVLRKLYTGTNAARFNYPAFSL